MRQEPLLRLLDVLKQELGADDARAEVGGREPSGPDALWTNLTNGWRVVICFDQPPAEPEGKQEHLEHLVAGFSQILDESQLPDGQLPASQPGVDAAPRHLDLALEALRVRTNGVDAVIVDIQSPVLWGSAKARHRTDDVNTLVDVGGALDAAWRARLDFDALMAIDHDDLSASLVALGVDAQQAALLGRSLLDGHGAVRRQYLMTCYAVARARADASRPEKAGRAHHYGEFGYFVRQFANIYLLVVVFEGPFSALHVESGVLRALPGIEQLLLALPPLDPTPTDARVIKLERKH